MTTQLPPQGPSEPDEKLPGEAELAALYRQLPQNEPGPVVDAAVLRAATQALASGEESSIAPGEREDDQVHPKPVTPSPVASPARGNRRSRPRWLIALSSAATLVIAAGLIWRMRELPPATSAPTAMDSAAPAQTTATATLPHAPATATPPAEPPPPPPPEPSKQPPPKRVVAPMSAPAADALRKIPADQRTERAYSKARVIGGLRQAAPAPMPVPSVALQETSGNAIKAASGVPTTMAVAPPAPPAPPTSAPSADGSAAVGSTVPNASDTPAQELDKIQQLFKQGHNDEALQRLTAFRHVHPHWNLPPELRAKLREP